MCMEKNVSVPILIPFEPEEFWAQIRIIIREEVTRNQKEQPVTASIMETPGLTEKPLYKIQEICSLFKITKPTIYDWIKHGKLKRVKIRSRVYFLGSDIRQLMQA
jgi:excisionase family DNA binding protein